MVEHDETFGDGDRVTSPDPVRDRFDRPLRSLRVSVTDRCNLRCRYCMPEDEYVWLPRDSILSFEEVGRLVRIFVGIGVEKIRLTGGEPLLRHELPKLVERIGAVDGVRDIAMTTNGVLLSRHAETLRAAGLHRITISLDTLRPDRYRGYSRAARLPQALAGIDAARAAGFPNTKINAVVVRGFNHDEILDLLEFAERQRAELRFIEYMDVGGATDWSLDKVVSREEILDTIRGHAGGVTPIAPLDDPSAPAERFRLPGGQVFGVIASTTAPFCRACDRARVTADGMFYRCLYADGGVDLRDPLRSASTDEEIHRLLTSAWSDRDDRGAEQRRELRARGVLYQIDGLRSDPHREMHTRGG